MIEQADGATDEAQLYAHVSRLLTIHESLLRDEARNLAFFEALQRSLTTGGTVLDIGSGSGIWAVVAAKAGAGRVIAIEQEPLLTGLIRNLAHENGVADRLEVVQGNSLQTALEIQCDVIISETIGHLIFDELIVQIMIDARRRFLKPGGVLIPQSVRLLAAPAHYPGAEKLPVGISSDFSYLESLILNVPVDLNDKRGLQLLAGPQELSHVDLTTVESTPDLSNLQASWVQLETSQVNCFAVWAEIGLVPGVKIETIETTSWSVILYRVQPFTRPQGDVEFTLKLTSSTNYWTASLKTPVDLETRSYSPALAGTELLARSRMPAIGSHNLKFGV